MMYNLPLFQCPRLLEELPPHDMLRNMVQLPHITMQALHTVDASRIRSASLSHRLSVAPAETDVRIALICFVGLNTGFNRELPSIECAAAYVDLGNDAAALAFEASLAPVGVYYAEHAQKLGWCRDPVGHAVARKEGGG